MAMMKTNLTNTYIKEIKDIISAARKKSYTAINYVMVEAYWLIGKRIVEQEQHGKKRAEYGEYVIQLAAKELTAEFGKGFSERSLRQYCQFYRMFPELQISQTLPNQSNGKIRRTVFAELGNMNSANTVRQISERELHFLSWSHIQRIMRVENPEARIWYMKEASEQMWSYRTLDRNISTLYYERLLLSQKNDSVVQEMEEKTQSFQLDKFAFIKNPTVLEFLGLPGNTGYTESGMEKAIIDNLQKFIMELGKGFAFVERQQLVRTETEDYYVDLVFYNYVLKCFVLIDLKMGKITHQDVGQMDMYVRMYDELKRIDGDNPTIGIVLCSETDNDIARYSILKGNEQLFATKYKLYLPTEAELKAEIERQKEILKLQFSTE